MKKAILCLALLTLAALIGAPAWAAEADAAPANQVVTADQSGDATETAQPRLAGATTCLSYAPQCMPGASACNGKAEFSPCGGGKVCVGLCDRLDYGTVCYCINMPGGFNFGGSSNDHLSGLVQEQVALAGCKSSKKSEATLAD